MSPRTLIVALVGVGCVGAAGVGGYLAVREGTSTSSAAPAIQTSPALETAATPAAPAPTVSPAAARATSPEVSRPQASQPRTLNRPVSRAAQSRPTSARQEDRQPAIATARPAQTPDASSAAVPVETTAATVEQAAVPAEPVKPTFDEVTVAENSVIGIRLETPVSSETSRVEERVRARVTRDVLVDGRTAIPAGATLEGTVTLVEMGGSFKERARIGIRFTTMMLANNTRLAIRTETIFRDGDAPGGEATSKIGASAVVGAILGAVVGGKKGAAIGGTAGAAGGTAVVMAGGPNAAVIAAGPLTVRLTAPVAVQVSREDP